MDYVQECEVSLRNKHQNLAPAGLLQPISVPENMWTNIAMDFIEGLPKAKGKDTILVTVDRMTKYAHFFSLSSIYGEGGSKNVCVGNS